MASASKSRFGASLSALSEPDQRRFIAKCISDIQEDGCEDAESIRRVVKATWIRKFDPSVSCSGSSVTGAINLADRLNETEEIEGWGEISEIYNKKPEPTPKAEAKPRRKSVAPAPAPVVESQQLEELFEEVKAAEEEADQAESVAAAALEEAKSKKATARKLKKQAEELDAQKARADQLKRREERNRLAEEEKEARRGRGASAVAAGGGLKISAKRGNSGGSAGRSPKAARGESPKAVRIDSSAAWLTDNKNVHIYKFCRHHKLAKASGIKTAACPAEISEEAFEETDADGKGWGLTPGDIAKLVEYGFVQDVE